MAALGIEIFVRKTLQHLLAEYGRVALVVYVVLSLTVLVGSWIAIRLGWRPESATGDAGTFTAACLITKLTQPLQIAVTLTLTPLVAKVQERLARDPGRAAPEGNTRTSELPRPGDLWS